MVSVIIPAYNAEKFIEKALDCAIKQDYEKLEIIVVDDGSTDNTLSLAQAAAAKHRPIKVISQPNGGPGAARNTGLENVAVKPSQLGGTGVWHDDMLVFPVEIPDPQVYISFSRWHRPVKMAVDCRIVCPISQDVLETTYKKQPDNAGFESRQKKHRFF